MSPQNRLQSIMGVAMPLFHARGVFQYSFGLLPYRKSIHTVGTADVKLAFTWKGVLFAAVSIRANPAPLSVCSQWGSPSRSSRLPVPAARTSRTFTKFTCRV